MKLKSSLLFMILDNHPSPNKYSKAFTNISNVIELEESEEFTFPQNIMKKFKEVEKKYNNFLQGIPLIVIERYYMDYRDDYNKYVFLEYHDNELTDVRIIDLFTELEKYYNDIFNLACLIANYYNLEVKLNENASRDKSQKYI